MIWAGLGRTPSVAETPTIAVEFASRGKRNFVRDYQDKRHEYASVGIKEYWVVNRFDRTLMVYRGKTELITITENETCKPDCLPGFELPLAELLAAADKWDSAVDSA